MTGKLRRFAGLILFGLWPSFAFLLLSDEADAQSQGAVVYATCSIALYNTAIGQVRALTQDINGNLCTNDSGGGSGGAVTIADGADVALGATADAAWAGSGSGTVVATTKYIGTQVAAVSAKLPASLGAKTGANSLSVVPASDATFVVSNAGTFTVQAAQSGAWLNGIKGADGSAIVSSTNPLPNTLYDSHGTQADFTTGTLITPTSQYPQGSVAITGNATGTTGSVVGTLAGTAGKTTYICGFDVSAIGGTATVGPITVAGLKGSSAVYQLASAAGGVTMSRSFTPCIPASSTNTAITITTTADGTATAVDVNSSGYQL